ncbi:beta family protein [Herbaspirillum huttiense]|uniref:T4 beta protein n=2 Tax=Herbaspirillum huttiense TaxID=863372 RepID=A0AAJ2H499_9BURK|nr:hypothetical protein [Herbaspirillum huttiense]MDR9836409.1 hypothetical protein [Herbaspirillum huttiense]
MTLYVPFLKMKQNEIGAISAISQHHRNQLRPFFDIPKTKTESRPEIIARITTAKKQADKELSATEFYLDNYDVDDSVDIGGPSPYGSLLNYFREHRVIPVIALNRHQLHNQAALAFAAKRDRKVLLRLTSEDMESYRLAQPQLMQLYKSIAEAGIAEIQLALDFRVIKDKVETLASNAEMFLRAFRRDYVAHSVIVAGSSIPASVRDLLKTKDSAILDRREWELWENLRAGGRLPSSFGDVAFGDYGVVSPDYTDVEMNFAMLQNVAAPKAFYTFEGKFFVVRGGAFKTHPDKYRQYYAIADLIASQSYFRDVSYSFGERYIYERTAMASSRSSKPGSPGSWLKATLSSHFTYIVDELL